MPRVGFVWILMVLLTAGCTAPSIRRPDAPIPLSPSPACWTWAPASPSPGVSTRVPTPVPTYNGTGRISLEPARPTLEPGRNVALAVAFENRDCRTFAFTEGPCIQGWLTVGDPPLTFLPGGDVLRLGTMAAHSCPPFAQTRLVAPGETWRGAASWNGSMSFLDHSAAERGDGWVRRTYWAATGDWPIEYGFSSYASYPAMGRATLHVAENDLNRGSPLGPGRCHVLGFGSKVDATMDVAMSISTTRPRIGTPVDTEATYALHVPTPGCYVLQGTPYLTMGGPTGGWSRTLGPDCGVNEVRPVLVDASSTTVQVRFRVSWDGRSQALDPCGQAAPEGEARVRFFAPAGLATTGTTSLDLDWIGDP